MSRPLLVMAVGLASYALLSSVASLLVMVVWQAGLRHRADGSPAVRARRLVTLRTFPATAAAIVVTTVVMPAFLISEPVRAAEAVGPVLMVLALFGLVLLAGGLALAVHSVLATWRIERRWLRAARPLDFDPPAGVPAFAADSFTPAVALVGVFAPKLIAARTVVEACNHDELAIIVAHERGHLHARDNVKRWLMACAPDVLRWTPAHRAIARAWDDAAEDAADDAATGGHDVARVDLAALLVKVARLSAGPALSAATISPFIERDRLDRRVRRLLSATQGSEVPRSSVARLLVGGGLVTVMLAIFNSPSALKAVHEAVEAVVAFGR
jgi:beta-lactamase regulating signal transducer with metallopeptidase domain